MGTHASVDIPNCDDEKVFKAVFNRFHQIIERFSPFKPNSELCRFQRGELTEDKLSDEMKMIIQECKKAEKMTDGYFSAYFDGRFNPTGYVKGWAIAEAGNVIEKFDYKTYCISVGGDILARSNSDKVWRIGIQDPTDKSKMLDLSSILGKSSKLAPHQNLNAAVGNRIAEYQVFGAGLSISNGAVATSGSYERGGHVINPKTKKPNNELLSMTVVGPDIVIADVLATAGFAMGKKGTGFISKQKDYDGMAVKAAEPRYVKTSKS